MKSLRITFLIISLSAAIVLQFVQGLATAEEETIAVLNGEPITRSQVEALAAQRIYRLRWEIYSTLKKEAEDLVDKRLLAEEANRRGISVEDLLRAEVEEKAGKPTDEEVDAYMKENDLSQRPGEDIRGRIVAYLTDRDKIQRRLDFLEALRSKAKYEFLLEPPPRPRAIVSIDDDPMRGNPDAPVTIIHFASFSCEHCAESARKIQRLMEEFPGAIRWVHRDSLNLFDERGLMAAEAGETAHAQGKFWEFHDRIYSLSGDFTQEDIRKILEEVGVAPTLYDRAHKNATYLLEIKHDIEDGVAAGVMGVPAIFINGRYISGTFPYARLKEMVEEELQPATTQAKKEAKSAP